jgi:iron complex outermembrane receptor protein
MISKTHRHMILLLSATSIVTATPAWAQETAGSVAATGSVSTEANDGGLADIVVTAQKREQNLQQVGIAITAVTGDSITQRNITSSADLASHVVGLENFSPYGPGTSANIVIRGIGLNDFGEGHEAPVTSYVDEFYIVSVPAVDFATFDLDRVEILRGPQGTLFGRNSTGGLINYVTRRPSQTANGYFQASYGNFNDLKLEGAASAPLTDTLSMRISGTTHTSDGFQRNLNPNLERGGQADTQAVRAQLRYQGGNGWDVVLKGEYGRSHIVHSYYESKTGYVDPATGLVIADPTVVDAAGYAERNTPAAAKNVVNTDGSTFLRSSGYAGQLRVEKKFGDITFTSLSGYQSYRRNMAEDSDGTPNNIVQAYFPYQSQEASQEFRLYHSGNSVRWTAGVYGLHAIGHDQPTATFNIPTSPPTTIDPTTGLYTGDYFPVALAAHWRLRTNSIAVFGQIEKDIGDVFTLIAGARVTRDSKTFGDSDNAVFRTCSDGTPDSCFLTSQGGTGTAHPFSLDYKKTLISGKVEADYHPSRNLLIYASISRGTKAGGFNNGFYPSGITLAQIPYGAETLSAYEFGEKATLLDRHLRINTSAFYYDYHNFQTFNYFGVAGLLSNQDAANYGVETEIEAALTRNFNVYVSAAYLHTNIQDVSKATPSGAIVTADRQEAFAPKWSTSGGATYTLPLTNNRSMVLDWNFEARTSRFTGNFGDPGTQLEGFFKHNASLTYTASENWQVRGFVNNISNRLNTTYAGPSFASLGIIQVRYAIPRTYGASITYKW